MRWLVRIAVLLSLIWSAATAALFLFRHDLIYPFRDWPRHDQIVGVPDARMETLTSHDGLALTLWTRAARPGQPTVLYFMGNAGALPASAPRLREMALRGFGIVALNYRGAGGAPGKPRQADLVKDGLAAYDRAAAGAPPVIWGTSLGAALAVQVASRRPASAVILETPFARLCATAEAHYPMIPACLILFDETWASEDRIGQLAAPLLVLHGDADRIIPIEQGRALFDKAPQPKEFLTYPGGRHNDLRLHGAGQDIITFLVRQGLARP